MIRGLEKQHEQDAQKLIRDTRTLGQRIYAFFDNPLNVAVLIGSTAAGAFVLPAAADVLLLLGIGFYLMSAFRKTTLPFRLPMRSNALDYNDPLPGSTKPRVARGIYFFGNDIKTNDELWFNNDDMRTHVLIFGSTGSGKTEALVSMAFNSLVQGSGFIYVDGKGDNSLFTKIFSMARRMGREDDMLLINFMTGARDIIGAQEKRLSNTMNPFSQGSSSMLTQLVVSLMDSGGADSSGDMWKGRAIAFVEALMRVLVYMRDQGHVLLDANIIRNYFSLTRLETIVLDKSFIRDYQEPIGLNDVPDVILEPLKNYVINLPGYDLNRKGKQVSQVLEQHGFITMQLTRVFGSLADAYGHIIRTNLPEVDMKDVVLNRRILVVLLPALEKSPDELSNLGKVIIASLKAMMAAGLGEDVEGSYRDVILRKPTNAPTPYLCILDEYGYYAVKGFAVVPAQARSLGFSTVFAGQDLPAFQKASKEEAASIGANTNIKICMKLEDPLETWDFFNKTAGESYVTKVDSFQTSADTITNSYADARSASSEKRARIDLLDLKDQREGEAHIFFKSRIVRAKMFYADPKPIKEFRLNQFLKVEPLGYRKLLELDNSINKLHELSKQDIIFHDKSVDAEEIEKLALALNQCADQPPYVAALAVINEIRALQQEIPAHELDITTTFDEPLNIFLGLKLEDEGFIQQLAIKNLEDFAKPLLTYQSTASDIEMLERLSGKPAKVAANIAVELLKDLRVGTQYPPADYQILDSEFTVNMIDELCNKLNEQRTTSNETLD